MRRVALAALALALSTPQAATAGPEAELRWIAYVRGSPERGNGALVLVRSDGSGERVRIRGEVTEADLGGSRLAHAILTSPEDPSRSRLVRARIGGRGDPQDVTAGPRGAYLIGLAASPEDEVAIQRYVAVTPEVPDHLEGTLEELARFEPAVLAPPDRPPGTTDTVADGTRQTYDLLFTNDPEGEQAHVDQVNVFVRGSTHEPEAQPDAAPTPVRGTTGSFWCGASACFLDWEEDGVFYTVGEFGSPEQAAGFAESLRPMENLAGPVWRSPGDVRAPELVVLRRGGEEELESVRDFCECGYHPVDWNEGATRLLVVLGVEGFTALHEYGAGGEPTVIREGTEAGILDAAYGPDGILLLEAPGFRRRGEVRTLEGETLAEDVRSFDVAGSTFAYVTGDRRVMVRDLRTGEERQVGERAFGVSVGPDLLVRPTRAPPSFPPVEAGRFPWMLVAVIAAAAAALGLGTYLIVRSRRQARR